MKTKQVRSIITGKFDDVRRKADGTWEVRVGYFYRHGGSSDKVVVRVIDALGVTNVQVVAHGDHWAPWPKHSYFWATFKVVNEERPTPRKKVEDNIKDRIVVTGSKKLDGEKYRAVRAYVFAKGESILENLMNRRSRPIHVYRAALAVMLEQLNMDPALADSARWSQKAGCGCGCSPGFVIPSLVGRYSLYCDVTAKKEEVPCSTSTV